MTDAERGEKALNEMYVFIMSGMSAAAATLDGKAGTVFSVGMGGVDGVKDILTHPHENYYEAVGRTVGDMIGIVGTFASTKYVASITSNVSAQAGGAFSANEVITHANLGDTFANLFNTYVANADAFYSKILTDKDYASKVWNGLKENGLDNFVHYFDPDGDGNVSPKDIIDGYKKLFSPPPAFGTAEFQALYSSTDKTKIIVDSQNHELQKETYKHIVQHDDINKITINSKNYDISKLDNLNHKKTMDIIDNIDEVSFLLSDILIKTGEKIDIDSYDTYTVKSGDTFSVIAQEHGYTTKDLVKLNPWLFDEKRIKFDYPDKILIEEGNVMHNDNNQTLREQPQSSSLLSPEMRYDNRQIAEFDIDEDENKPTQTQENKKGAYLMENGILLSSGPSTTAAEDIKLDTKNNEDDYGMEM